MKYLLYSCSFFLMLFFNFNESSADDPSWSQKITECDRQASHRLDPYRVAPGVSKDKMNFELAEAACLDDIAEDPENPRLNYQLGRVYGYSGRWEKAMPYRMKAVDAEYPQSLFVIGWLYLTGETINEKNPCRTILMWKKSAELGRLAAQVALPRHYMLGDFVDCDIKITSGEMKLFLNAADSQTEDYYTGMLIEDLSLKLSKWKE